MDNHSNSTEQMELGFNGKAQTARPRRQQTRVERAAWWFDKMRTAVDSALEWTARPTPPPQQLWLAQ